MRGSALRASTGSWVNAGVLVLGTHGLVRSRTTVVGIGRSLHLSFLVFVLALGVVVEAVMANGLQDQMARLVPGGTSLTALLGIAVVAAVLSNVVNNLPAVLVLLPLVAGAGPAAVLAVLIGVNIGPNLTYIGSLSNLLWHRVLGAHGISTRAAEFTMLGALTVPLSLVAAVVTLWGAVRMFGA